MNPTSEKMVAECLRGDVITALSLARSVSQESLTSRERRFVRRFQRRFTEPLPQIPVSTRDETVRAIVRAYRRYWNRCLLRLMDTEMAENLLFRELKQALGMDFGSDGSPSSEDRDAIQSELESACSRRNLHVLLGRVLPFYELMIWKHERTETRRVELPEGGQEVIVVFLDSFICYGWTHYCTLGSRSTGGWAAADRIYCVAPRWKLTSENFRVSFLGHEAQHFSDYARFPGLCQTDLEYRAKLTEIILARRTQKGLIRRFAAQARLDPDSPHSFACTLLIERMGEALGDKSRSETLNILMRADRNRIIDAAHDLLIASSRCDGRAIII